MIESFALLFFYIYLLQNNPDFMTWATSFKY